MTFTRKERHHFEAETNEVLVWGAVGTLSQLVGAENCQALYQKDERLWRSMSQAFWRCFWFVKVVVDVLFLRSVADFA